MTEEEKRRKIQLYREPKDIELRQAKGLFPLLQGAHMCSERGHNMFLVWSKDNEKSIFGVHKCSRCGYEYEFQYDF